VTEYLAVDGAGNALVSFERGDESGLNALDPAIPLPLALVALWQGHRCLTVFDRWKQAWELPGGVREDNESPRDAAWRELHEETGQRPGELQYVGVATIRFGDDGRLEYAALFTARIVDPLPFAPNSEIEKTYWWDVTDDLRGMAEIDTYLARLCVPDR
jgi:8-oxo-dGTP diphosphatase